MGAWDPGWLQGVHLGLTVGGWAGEGELEQLVSVQCAQKRWVVLSVTDGKVLVKLSHVLRYSRQGQIMQCRPDSS